MLRMSSAMGLSKDAADISTTRAIKHLYNHSLEDSDDYAKWSEFEDPVEEEQNLKLLAQSYAIVHRFSRHEISDGKYTWKTHSIEIRSPRLKRVLATVFDDYPNCCPDDKPHAFFPPFKPFIHRWRTILLEFSQQKDPLTTIEFARLREILKPLLEVHFTALENAETTKAVFFDTLWLTFAPGDLVVTTKGGTISVCKLRTLSLETPMNCPRYWCINMEQVEWNGGYFGFASTTAEVIEFSGSQLATNLRVCPLDFFDNADDIMRLVAARGEKFASLCGFHVKTCVGTRFIRSQDIYGRPKEVAKPVSGRVIVDAYAFYECQAEVAPNLSRVPKESQHTLSEDVHDLLSRDVTIGDATTNNVSDGDMISNESEEEPHSHSSVKKGRKEEIRLLTKMECILAVPRVKGFDLKSKEWCEFNVDDIQEPDWKDDAYDNLVLAEGEKELALAFANRSRHCTENFDDFVQHKGEGIIILLCGPPGVGKTLTAEAVAEKCQIPLYVLSAGDLGTRPEKVESALNNALECCRLWNAVLLLDEADVFLEKRESKSLDRNELVSIFLRRLEYYQGIMFLTTNRIDVIDVAFKSRIDLILPYYNLDESARRGVWVNFIRRLPLDASEIEDADFDELAKTQMNGRDIKNTIKTAQVLAAPEGTLTMKHLRIVLDIRKRCADIQPDSSHPTASTVRKRELMAPKDSQSSQVTKRVRRTLSKAKDSPNHRRSATTVLSATEQSQSTETIPEYERNSNDANGGNDDLSEGAEDVCKRCTTNRKGVQCYGETKESYRDLCKSAREGCKRCLIISKVVQYFGGDKYEFCYLSSLGNTMLEAFCTNSIYSDRLGAGIKGSYTAIEFYTTKDLQPCWPDIYVRNHLQPLQTIDNLLPIIREWLHNCCATHSPCNNVRGFSYLPTRILDLGCNTNSDDSICLLETNGLEGTYMTLSHCWGTSQHLITTNANVVQHKKGIAFDDLVQTYKDAITITRALGIQYLWIDSLCIIQDDSVDWVIESSKMADIYSNSLLNIAATSSADDSGGCFSNSVREQLDVRNNDHGPSTLFARQSTGDAHDSFESRTPKRKPPLLTRAWVYQERFLSPRTIHFHELEMIWECKSTLSCECGKWNNINTSSWDLPPLRHDELMKDEALVKKQWSDIMMAYSPLKLTKHQDRLPALSGIASRFAKYTKCDYLAGFWRNNLPEDLLWVKPNPDVTVQDTGTLCRAPSWSWASAAGNFRDKFPWKISDDPIDERLSMLDAQCELSGDNRYGEVSNGTLLIKGACLGPLSIPLGSGTRLGLPMIFVSKRFQNSSITVPGNSSVNIDRPITPLWCGNSGYVAEFYPDWEQTWDNNYFTGTLFLIFRPSGIGLVLKESATEAGTYQRIGMGQVVAVDGSGTEGFPVKTVKIV